MRVLGIDPGSRFCGFGVVEDAGGTRMRHLGHGVLALGEERSVEGKALEAKLFPVRRPSTIACGRSLSVPLRTIV